MEIYQIRATTSNDCAKTMAHIVSHFHFATTYQKIHLLTTKLLYHVVITPFSNRKISFKY